MLGPEKFSSRKVLDILVVYITRNGYVMNDVSGNNNVITFIAKILRTTESSCADRRSSTVSILSNVCIDLY